MAAPLIYLTAVLITGSLNPSEWSKIQKEKDQQIIFQHFHQTAGKDSIIDYKEFEEFYKKNFYNK